jgi:hypothetical protein
VEEFIKENLYKICYIYHKERFLDACDDLPIGVTHLKTKLQEHG